MQERFSWSEHASQFDSSHPIYSFASTIERLGVIPKHISGDVLIAGHGGAFPERVFVCTQSSRFKTLRPEIKSLTCTDPGLFTNPNIQLNAPVITRFPGEIPITKQPSINFLPDSLQTLLPHMNKALFDTILFFRIRALHEQLEDGLLELIHGALKPEAFFIGSGGFENEQKALQLLQTRFEIITTTLLPNSDDSGYQYQTHLGFILQK